MSVILVVATRLVDHSASQSTSHCLHLLDLERLPIQTMDIWDTVGVFEI